LKVRKSRWILGIVITVVAAAAILLLNAWRQQRQVRADEGTGSSQVVAAFVGELSTRANASGTLLPAREAQLTFSTPGQVEEILVHVGDSVRAGDALVRLGQGDLERAVSSAEQALVAQQANLAELLQEPDAKKLAAAQASVASAQAQLDDLLAGPSAKEIAQSEASVASAQAQLDDVLAGPGAAEFTQAEAALASAKTALRVAQESYDAQQGQLVIAQNDIDNAKNAVERARWPYDAIVLRDWKAAVSWGPYTPQAAAYKQAQVDYQVALANYEVVKAKLNNSAVLAAQAQVAQAQASLANLTKPKTVQIASARAQLAQAEADLATLTGDQTVQIAGARAQLAQAEANLEHLVSGSTEDQIAIAKARVEKARIALDRARNQLDNATLTAPFDGIVTQVYVQVGESAAGPVAELIDPSSLEVVLDVDEVDIGSISVGQPANVTLDTWPDQVLEGTVLSIDPEATNVADIVNYEVHLSLVSGDLPIRAGMSANGELVTADLTDVLLAPNRAIIADRQAGKYYVLLVQGSEQTRTEVTIGLRDNTNTQILSGLKAGDKLFIGQTKQGLDFTQGPPSAVREMNQ
jgi:HlyD family secretion protein